MSKCNCIKDIENKVKQHYQEKETIEEVTSVSLESVAFMLDSCQTQMYSPMVVEYDYRNKKQVLKHKKEKVNMSYSYCPFCGLKYKKDNEGEE